MSNHRTITLASIFISLSLLLGCENDIAQAKATETPATLSTISATINTTGTVIESINASGYTYAKVEMDDGNIWIAGPKTTLAQGETIDIDTSSPMYNFHSKSLNRDFPVIYFINHYSGNAVQGIAVSTATELPTVNKPITSPHTEPSKTISLDQALEPAKGGHTIAEIFINRKELAGKVVKVRGKVTKFTANVMKHNWIHIVDGSGDNDLTVITDQIAAIDQIIVIEGTVLLDKDFGYGYLYELLINDAKVAVE